MISKKPILSVITVCFNAQHTIENCIKSVISQKNKYIEYIIVDGASSDDTYNIIKKYKNNIDNIIHEKDNGIFDAMNKGFNISSGEYIAFLNADDIYMPNTIKLIIESISKSNNFVDIFYGDWIGINSEGCKIYRKAQHKVGYKYSLCHQAIFAKRSIFPAPNPFNLKYKLCADFDLVLFWLKSKNRFCKIPSPLVEFSEVGSSAIFIRNSAFEDIAIIFRRRLNLATIILAIRIFAYYCFSKIKSKLA